MSSVIFYPRKRSSLKPSFLNKNKKNSAPFRGCLTVSVENLLTLFSINFVNFSMGKRRGKKRSRRSTEIYPLKRRLCLIYRLFVSVFFSEYPADSGAVRNGGVSHYYLKKEVNVTCCCFCSAAISCKRCMEWRMRRLMPLAVIFDSSYDSLFDTSNVSVIGRIFVFPLSTIFI